MEEEAWLRCHELLLCFPFVTMCVTKSRNGEACIGNRKLEQETTAGARIRNANLPTFPVLGQFAQTALLRQSMHWHTTAQCLQGQAASLWQSRSSHVAQSTYYQPTRSSRVHPCELSLGNSDSAVNALAQQHLPVLVGWPGV